METQTNSKSNFTFSKKETKKTHLIFFCKKMADVIALNKYYTDMDQEITSTLDRLGFDAHGTYNLESCRDYVSNWEMERCNLFLSKLHSRWRIMSSWYIRCI